MQYLTQLWWLIMMQYLFQHENQSAECECAEEMEEEEDEEHETYKSKKAPPLTGGA